MEIQIRCRDAMAGVLDIRYFVKDVRFFVKKKIEYLAYDVTRSTDAILYS